MGLDCGPQSIAKNAEAIAKSKTIMWNGPKDMMNKILLVTSTVAITVIGRRGTVTACKKYGTQDKVTHCSTGGGASLYDQANPRLAPAKALLLAKRMTEAPVATVPEERSAEDAAGKNVAEVGDLSVQFSPRPRPGQSFRWRGAAGFGPSGFGP